MPNFIQDRRTGLLLPKKQRGFISMGAGILTPYRDPYFNKVVTLLPLNGANNGTLFPDATGKIFTAGGNAKTVTSQSIFYGSSASFDGNGDYVATSQNNAYNLSAQDFSIDGWINPSSIPATAFWGIVGSRNTFTTNFAWAIYIQPLNTANPGALTFAATNTGNGSTSAIESTGATVMAASWSFFEFSRSGTNLYSFMNGILIGTTPISTYNIVNTSVALGLGYIDLNARSGANNYNGFMQDIRITVGVCRHTSNYSLPTAPNPLSGP